MRNYDKGRLAAAVRSVNSGKMSYREAEKAYGVPRSTISEHVQRRRAYVGGTHNASRGSFLAGAAAAVTTTVLPRIKGALSAQQQAALDQWKNGGKAPVQAPQVAPVAAAVSSSPTLSRNASYRILFDWMESLACPIKTSHALQVAWVKGALTIPVPESVKGAAGRLWGPYGRER